RRGHSAEKSIEAIRKLQAETGVDIGVHLIFGIPGETRETIIATAKLMNELGVGNVKLHNLHVLKNTPLEQLFHEGSFQPIELEEYAERTILFLRHLSPGIAVQRLTAVASRWDELVAPLWTKEKMRPFQWIKNSMLKNNFR